MRSRLLLLLLLSLAALPVAAQSTDTLRVDVTGAIMRALEISPEVGIEAAGRDFAAARYRLARSSRFLTEFQVTSAHAPAPGLKNLGDTPVGQLYLNPGVRNDWDDLHFFSRVEVEAIQPLFTWGELGGSIRAARHGLAVEEATVEAKALEVAARTGELYYSVLLAEALFRLAAEAGDIVAQAKGEVERLLDEGAEDVDDADLFQVLITEQEFNRRVVEVAQGRETARTALRRQLFLPEDALVLPEEATLEPLALPLAPMETYFAEALRHRPELAQATAGLAAREALVTVARSDYFPKLFIGGSAKYSFIEGRFRQRNPYVGDPFLSRGVQLGVGVRQKLNFLQTNAKVAQAQAQADEVRHQQTAARQLVLFEVEQAYRNLVTANAAMASQLEAERISREWLRTEQINFDLDLGNTENLIKAVQANLQLQAATHEAVQKYNVAVVRLMKATGTLATQAQAGTLVE